MSDDMKTRYSKYYADLVTQFYKNMSGHNCEDLKDLPQPHLPLFGKNYSSAPLRVLFVGLDTVKWGDTCEFIKQGDTENPKSVATSMFGVMEEYQFLDWKKHIRTTRTFLGFIMAMLASIHIPTQNPRRWTLMKKKNGYEDILGSFAWANVNAIVTARSLRRYIPDAPVEMRNIVAEAGKHFNKLDHMMKTLNPHVVLILGNSLNGGGRYLNIQDSFFDDLKLKEQWRTHLPNLYMELYKIDGCNTYVIKTYHPSYMGRQKEGSPYKYLEKIAKVLKENNLIPLSS